MQILCGTVTVTMHMPSYHMYLYSMSAMSRFAEQDHAPTFTLTVLSLGVVMTVAFTRLTYCTIRTVTIVSTF